MVPPDLFTETQSTKVARRGFQFQGRTEINLTLVGNASVMEVLHGAAARKKLHQSGIWTPGDQHKCAVANPPLAEVCSLR